jgi:hypothetical protein
MNHPINRPTDNPLDHPINRHDRDLRGITVGGKDLEDIVGTPEELSGLSALAADFFASSSSHHTLYHPPARSKYDPMCKLKGGPVMRYTDDQTFEYLLSKGGEDLVSKWSYLPPRTKGKLLRMFNIVRKLDRCFVLSDMAKGLPGKSKSGLASIVSNMLSNGGVVRKERDGRLVMFTRLDDGDESLARLLVTNLERLNDTKSREENVVGRRKAPQEGPGSTNGGKDDVFTYPVDKGVPMPLSGQGGVVVEEDAEVVVVEEPSVSPPRPSSPMVAAPADQSRILCDRSYLLEITTRLNALISKNRELERQLTKAKEAAAVAAATQPAPDSETIPLSPTEDWLITYLAPRIDGLRTAFPKYTRMIALREILDHLDLAGIEEDS